MDDEVVGINNGDSVIHIVTCMIMIRSYVPGFSRRLPVVVDVFKVKWRAVYKEYNGAAQWCLGGYYLLFTKHQIFCGNFTLFLSFHSFSNGQKAKKPPLATFSSITMFKSKFFPTKKKPKKNLILGGKTRFCGDSHN